LLTTKVMLQFPTSPVKSSKSRQIILNDARFLSPHHALTDARCTVRAVAQDGISLIILDSCEHVIEAAALFLEQVLGQAPDTRILATSREALTQAGQGDRP
jgi:predicted ATPase